MFKQAFVLTAAALSLPAWATPVTSVSCKGNAKIQATAEPSFTPAVTYEHPSRALPIPAQITFKAVVEVKAIASGCGVLADKYGLDFAIGTTLLVDVSASEGDDEGIVKFAHSAPDGLGEKLIFDAYLASALAEAAVGKTIAFQVNQEFTYALNHTLPLFPNVHEETLTIAAPVHISTAAGAVAMHVAKPYQVDVQAVYGVTPVAELSDVEKLAAAAQVTSLAMALGESDAGPGLPDAFQNLLLAQLEPSTLAHKVQYKDLLLLIFQGVAKSPDNNLYFDFEVGGSGGSSIAQKLVELSVTPKIFLPDEAAELLYTYPGFALISEGTGQCLVSADGALASLLTKASANVTLLTQQQKWLFSQITGYIANGYWNITKCFHDATKPEVKTLAAALQQKL